MKLPRIAVTGLGVVCSIGRDTDEFLEGLRAGRLGITDVEYLDTLWSPCKIGGEVKAFEPVPISDLSVGLSRADTFAVTAATEALEQSGLDGEQRARHRIGASMGTCQNAVAELGEFLHTGSIEERLAGSPADAIAMVFGLTGPRAVASNACAAGGSAISMARDQLWAGAADVMLAGGSDGLAFFTYAGFSVLHSLDLEPCSPYGRSNGLTLGEGAAVFVLETFEHAQERGASIIAELAGCGGSADGHHPTAPDPTGRGAALAMQRALQQARIGPAEVDYVNGHGTGTPSNDTMERAAFRLVFGDRAREVPISSTKSMIGHTLGAAGAVEAAVCVLAIRHGFLPPTINFPEVAPADFDFVPNVSRPAPVRVAASNNYAFGGSNASLVFTDPNRVAPAHVAVDAHRVLVTGFGAIGALGEGVEEWTDALTAGRSGIKPMTIADATRISKCLGAEPPNLDAKRYASRNDWRKMNGFARMCVASARLAWTDAELSPARDELDDVALVFATAGGPLRDTVAFERAARTGADEAGPTVFPHVAVNAAAGHVCTVLGIHGPVLSFTQGGVSALVALQYAADLVRRGESEVAIVLAADELCETTLEGAEALPWPALATQVVRPFDERADGTAFGTAAVSIVLETAEHAARRHAQPYGELLGTSNVGSIVEADQDATVSTWIEAMELAIDRSGISSGDIGYCVAAASGINALDAMELAALAKLLGPTSDVGAPKSMTGECMGTTAAINLLVAGLALRHGVLAPTANLERPLAPFDVRHVTGRAIEASVDYCLVNACTPGATYGSIVLGRTG